VLAECLAGLGAQAYRQGRLEDAAYHFQLAVQAWPQAPELWLSLALATRALGDPHRAQEVVEEALRRFPDLPDGQYLLAELQEARGKTGEATETLKRLLRTHPEHARGRALLATLEREDRREGRYWTQESPRFLVRYEGAAGLDVARSVLHALEEAYDVVGRALDVFPPEKIQVGIYERDAFESLVGAPPHQLAGVWDGRRIRLNLRLSVAGSRRLTEVVRHEYTHLVIHRAARGRAPLWLHEGLAQLMEPRQPARQVETAVSRDMLSMDGMDQLLRAHQAPAVFTGYRLSLVAVAYLAERGGLPALRQFLARIGRNEAVRDAMRAVFGIGPDVVEARLRAVAGRG
jgi:tetratricopeptide (TPR) repeat protein